MNKNGVIAMFEHNPIARKAARTCPLDIGVRLLWPRYPTKLFRTRDYHQSRFASWSFPRLRVRGPGK